MGKGEELGRELRHWITMDDWRPASGTALANRLIDLLGEQDTLKAPLRDLAGQPQFLQLLRQPQPPSPAAVEALIGHLSHTYAPAVLAELQDLIHGALGLRSGVHSAGAPSRSNTAALQAPDDTFGEISRGIHATPAVIANSLAASPQPSSGSRFSTAAPAAAADLPSKAPMGLGPNSQPGLPAGSVVEAANEGDFPTPVPHDARSRWRGLARELIALAPGLALGFSVSLVLTWAAAQLDHALLDGWGWSGGFTLAVTLLGLQIGSSGPLRGLRRRALLSLPSSTEPRLAWRWFTAPWFHARGGEALTHVLLLLILLGPSPLPLNQVVLRYSLTALATQALAVLSARLSGMSLRRWGGAAGPVASLISLAACLSLLQWRELGFRLGLPGQLSVPAWVLLVVYASLQLAWQLPPTSVDDTSRPGDRLWSSTWWWGTLLGSGWGLLTWSVHAIGVAWRHSGSG